ncbi:MAG: gliding motility-associated C-terminal domain-containing protein [Bacteroidetes bacterium]|nr:MAG: gliding motility-associated C-terminal domain-containing protein [Bacteroidota bacterium]
MMPIPLRRIPCGLLLWAALLAAGPAAAQNLIPNADFSAHEVVGCPLPFESMAGLEDWYAIPGATVDYFLMECGYSVTGGTPARDAFEYRQRESFVGFWGLVRRDFTMASEAFGVPLRAPLAPGRAYAFSIDLRHRGLFHAMEGVEGRYCPTDPPMALQVYASQGPAGTTLNSDGAATAIEAPKVLDFNVYDSLDQRTSDAWTTFTGCFQAAGGEDHLTFSMTIDSFPPVAPCDEVYDPFAFDQWYGFQYFNADNLQLLPFPEAISDTLILCTGQAEVAFDPTPYFGDIDLPAYAPRWRDGTQGLVRAYQQPGRYEQVLAYACGQTRVTIEVVEKRCTNLPFVATAFTPNGDGHNDRFSPVFSSDFPVTDYVFTVFDRWGRRVYQSRQYDPALGWDGRRSDGKPAPGGSYAWTLRFQLLVPDRPLRQQSAGSVLLLR